MTCSTFGMLRFESNAVNSKAPEMSTQTMMKARAGFDQRFCFTRKTSTTAKNATPNKKVVQISSSLAETKPRSVNMTATFHHPVNVSPAQSASAQSSAMKLSAIVSVRTALSQISIGGDIAKASMTTPAKTPPHLFWILIATAKARRPQHTADSTVCKTTNDVGLPVTFHISGRSIGRWPVTKPRLRIGNLATAS